MNEIFEDEQILEQQLLKTLKSEMSHVDDLINTLLRNIRIVVEKLKRQMKNLVISHRKEQFLKLISPIKTFSHAIKEKIKDFFESYSETNSDIDFLTRDFCFPKIIIDKIKILKKFEQGFSKFSIEHYDDYFIKDSYNNTSENPVEFTFSHLNKFSKQSTTTLNSLITSLDFLPYKPNNNYFEEDSNNLLKILVTSDVKSNLQFSNWKNGNYYEIISNAHSRPLNVVKVIKDQNNDRKYYAVTGSDDEMIKFWETDSNYYKSVFSFPNYDLVNHIEIIPCGKKNNQDYVVTVGNERQIKIWRWDLQNKKSYEVTKIEIPEITFVSCLKSLFFESVIMRNYEKKSYIITGFINGSFKVWNWKKKNPLVLHIKGDSAVRSLLCIQQRFCSYKSLVKKRNFYYFYVIGYADGTINFFSTKGKLIKSILNAHIEEVSALEKLPINNENECKGYSEILISGGTDKFIRFWRWRSGQQLMLIFCEHRILGYNCLKVEIIYDFNAKKKKYILVSGGKKNLGFSTISTWTY